MPNPSSGTTGFHACVTWSAATPPVTSRNVGIASVVRSAQGVYVVTLGVGYAIDLTQAMCLASSETATAAILQVVQTTDTNINVSVFDDAHAALDAIVNLYIARIKV